MAGVTITHEDDPTPVVLGLAGTLKRAAAQPKLARRLAKMKGVDMKACGADAPSRRWRARSATRCSWELNGYFEVV